MPSEAPKEPKLPSGLAEKHTARRLIIVLEQASLETVKTKKGYELLNCDDHQGLHRKAGRDPAESRPDITHQLLLALLDSPLNKAGLLQIYIQTKKNVLIEVSPHLRIPRTFKRFAGLMGTSRMLFSLSAGLQLAPATNTQSDDGISCTANAQPSSPHQSVCLVCFFFVALRVSPRSAVQLLHKLKVKAADSSETLLKVVKNPVTAHLPIGAPIVGLEMGAQLVDAISLPSMLPTDKPLVFVVGAMSHGDITADYLQQTFSLSKYPLSAACSVSKLLNAFEHAWGVL